MTALEKVNAMPFQKLPSSRKELFEKTEKQELKPLPPSRYETAAFKTAKVNADIKSDDYHVQYEGFYYSVPFQYAHKQVEIRATTRTIEVLYEAYIVSLMEARDQSEQSFRTCTAILHLADTAPVQDMEKTAVQALKMRAYSYKSFEILLKRIGRETPAPINHENIRGPHYYREDANRRFDHA